MKDNRKKTKTETLAPAINPFPWLCGMLILTVLLYASMFQNQFTNWDDPGYITNNELIRDLSLEGIQKMFSFKDGFYGGNYHPITALSNAIDYHYFKLKPGPYHFQNLLFHLLNILLVFAVIKKLLFNLPNLKNLHEKRLHIALFSAFFFAIHPTHVESVAWLAERKDVLYTFFFLLSLWQYLNYSENRKPLFLLLSLIFFLLSLLSKFSAASLPLVLVLVDLLYVRKDYRRIALEKLPFLALSVAFGYIALQTQDATLNDITTPDYNILERGLVASRNLVFYLIYSIVPFKLANLHPFLDAGELDETYYLAALFFVGILVLMYSFRSNKIMLFSLAAFIATNLLTIHLLPVGKAVFAERYTYVPYIFLFIFFGEVLFNRLPKQSIGLRVPILLLLAGSFSYLSFARVKAWKDNNSLWSDEVKKYPDSYYAWFSAGQVTKKTNMAIPCYTKCIELKPDFAGAFVNRSSALHSQGHYIEALSDINMAMKLDMKPSLTNYVNRGAIYEGLKLNDSALADYVAAEKLDSTSNVLYYNMGNIYFDKGEYQTAFDNYSHSMQLNPSFDQARFNRAMTLVQLNRREEACPDFKELAGRGYKEAKPALDAYCR
ncbi:MAG: hypothetical protein EXR21_09710 [Flavobacteriaceae bacterium]|nr:hypothetical protein [Flavobacteriaceae bacterium]